MVGPFSADNHTNVLFPKTFLSLKVYGLVPLERWENLWIVFASTLQPHLSTDSPAFGPNSSTLFSKPGEKGAEHSLAELANQLFPVLAQLAVGLHQRADLPAGVQHGGVVAAGKGVADLRQAVLGELLGQRHRHLTRAC